VNDVPSPDDYSEKEVYAFFGLAAYSVQVLEKALVNMVVIFRTCGLPISVEQYDEVFADHDSKTIDQLVRRAQAASIPIPEETQLLLEQALDRRNYLNHDFYADYAGHFMTEEGRSVMIDRLRELTRLFQRAERACEPIYLPLMKKMGVTAESVEQQVQALMAEAQDRA
jgi:hypothetical protein